MNLLEYQGKQLMAQYGITIPRSVRVSWLTKTIKLPWPVVLKSQVAAGDRFKKGGIVMVKRASDFRRAQKKLFATPIDTLLPTVLLAEEKVAWRAQYYVSVSFDTHHRSPVWALSAQGGTGITAAQTFPVTYASHLPDFKIRELVRAAGLPLSRPLLATLGSVWRLFMAQKALLVEINPLFVTRDGRYVAGDAKVVLDDNVVAPEERPYVELGGNIAVLASGGGASMLNLDALQRVGGQPANYVEYSGNPRSDVVRQLTRRVLGKKGLKGLWVVGGTANFTDIYETLKGFAEGLQAVRPKPTYPIVIRRDGPRRAEAFAYLQKFAARHRFDMYLCGPEISMADTAAMVTRLAYARKR